MFLVSTDTVVLVRISLLPEENVFGLQGSTEQHALLVVNIVIMGAMHQVVRLVPQVLQVVEYPAMVVAGSVVAE